MLLTIALMAVGVVFGAALMLPRVPKHWLVVLFSGAVPLIGVGTASAFC